MNTGNINSLFFIIRKNPFVTYGYDKKTNEPYIGVVKGLEIDHPMLEQGNRKRMKIMRINSCPDIPIESIYKILQEATKYYK